MQFVLDHTAEILSAVALVLSLAAVVVKFTPTKRDDEIVARVLDVVAKYLPTVEVGKKPTA